MGGLAMRVQLLDTDVLLLEVDPPFGLVCWLLESPPDEGSLPMYLPISSIPPLKTGKNEPELEAARWILDVCSGRQIGIDYGGEFANRLRDGSPCAVRLIRVGDVRRWAKTANNGRLEMPS